MTKHDQRSAEPEIKPEKQEEIHQQLPRKENEGSEDACRCKEAKDKTFTQLLKAMLKDLAFWKKDK